MERAERARTRWRPRAAPPRCDRTAPSRRRQHRHQRKNRKRRLTDSICRARRCLGRRRRPRDSPDPKHPAWPRSRDVARTRTCPPRAPDPATTATRREGRRTNELTLPRMRSARDRCGGSEGSIAGRYDPGCRGLARRVEHLHRAVVQAVRVPPPIEKVGATGALAAGALVTENAFARHRDRHSPPARSTLGYQRPLRPRRRRHPRRRLQQRCSTRSPMVTRRRRRRSAAAADHQRDRGPADDLHRQHRHGRRWPRWMVDGVVEPRAGAFDVGPAVGVVVMSRTARAPLSTAAPSRRIWAVLRERLRCNR